MILYGSSLSPFVRKVLAFAGEKGIELDVVPVGPGVDNPDFFAASPFRKMPALCDGDFRISDSSAIIAYLDALHPEPNLIPLDPRARAKAIWFDEFADTIFGACNVKMFFNRVVAPRFLKIEGDAVTADKAQAEELPPLLAYLEGVIPDSGFLLEDRLTLADIAVAAHLPNLTYVDAAICGATYPRLFAYARNILGRDSFKRYLDKEERLLARAA